MGRGAVEGECVGASAREAEAGPAQAEVEVAVLQIDDVELVVLGLRAEVPVPELSDAEQGVVQLVLDGCSNQEVARRRGASVKTVANQLQMIYRKLGIGSRFELATRLAGSEPQTRAPG
jgi:DNA-binding CsgD family transcriptional regulator